MHMKCVSNGLSCACLCSYPSLSTLEHPWGSSTVHRSMKSEDGAPVRAEAGVGPHIPGSSKEAAAAANGVAVKDEGAG